MLKAFIGSPQRVDLYPSSRGQQQIITFLQLFGVFLLNSSSFGIACFVHVKLFMQPFINTLNKYKLHITEKTVAVTMCQEVFS